MATQTALRRFPLVARPRIACPPLTTRLAEIADLAAADNYNDTADDGALLVAVAHNKAALIASDLGLPDLARTLCWRHHDRYRPVHPWTARHARLALEPLINLARLDIRHGRPDDAVALLTALWRSVNTGNVTVIAGQPVSMNGLAPGTDDHRTVRTWLWTVVLAEGLRALAAAGRWNDALAHAQQHHGIGRRLLDGRQIAILAHGATGNHNLAIHLIHESDVREPWERTVAACLTTAVGHASSLSPRADTTLVDHYLDLDLGVRHAVFTIRLGLTIIDLNGGPEHPDNAQAVARIHSQARSTVDAYVAREVLGHPLCATLSLADKDHLQTIHTSAYRGDLDDGRPVTQHLLAALDTLPQHAF